MLPKARFMLYRFGHRAQLCDTKLHTRLYPITVSAKTRHVCGRIVSNGLQLLTLTYLESLDSRLNVCELISFKYKNAYQDRALSRTRIGLCSKHRPGGLYTESVERRLPMWKVASWVSWPGQTNVLSNSYL